MKQRILAGILTIAMTIGVFAGCSSDREAKEEHRADVAEEGANIADDDARQKVIGLAMPNESFERWKRDGAYLQAQFESMGYQVIVKYSDNDADKQAADIQKMIADQVDALVIAAVNGETLTEVLERAADQDIPVIAYDRMIMNTKAVSYYVSFDNYMVGALQGQYLEDVLDLANAGDKSYTLEIMSGDPGDSNALYFYQGAMDILQKYIDGGALVVTSGQTAFEETSIPQWDTSNAMDRMQYILGAFYGDGTDLDACLCSNDTIALGVEQALDADYKGKQPIITGQDGDRDNLRNLLDGKQSMTIFKAVANEAVTTLNLVDALMKGDKPDAGLIDTSGWSFDCSYDTDTYDNGEKVVPSYLLVPSVVTKENYKEILVDSGYYTEDEDGYLKAE